MIMMYNHIYLTDNNGLNHFKICSIFHYYLYPRSEVTAEITLLLVS